MYAIGEASRRSGVGIETIRYYERTGLIGRAGRSPAGRRVFSRGEVARLRLIRTCRDLGFPVPVVRAIADLAGSDPQACAAVASMGEAQLAGVRRKIAELRQLEGILEDLLNRCAGSENGCPMLAHFEGEKSGGGS